LFDDNGALSSQYFGDYYVNNSAYSYDLASNSSYNGFRIKVSPNTTYTLSTNDGSTIHTNIRYVGSSLALISGNGDLYNATSGSFTTPSNCVYIEISKLKTTTFKLMLNEGNHAYPYVPYNANKHITNDEAQFLKNVMPNFYQIKKFTGTWGQWVNTKGNDNVNVLKALVSHEISEDDYHYVDLIKTYDSVLESIAWVYLNSGSSSPFHDVSDDNEVIIYYVDLYEA
jgi:hypothetical protein